MRFDLAILEVTVQVGNEEAAARWGVSWAATLARESIVLKAARSHCTAWRSPSLLPLLTIATTALSSHRVGSSEDGIEGLVRLRGQRKPQRFAGRRRASSVASRWGTPRRDAGIRARITTGRLCWVAEGTRSLNIDLFSCGDLRVVAAAHRDAWERISD